LLVLTNEPAGFESSFANPAGNVFLPLSSINGK